MLDINWRDAMAVRAIAGSFTREEREAGWPVAMQPEQLAAMQRPFLSGDVQGKRLTQALRDALQAACQGQAIACESEVRRVMVRPAVDHVPPRTSMFGRVENWPEAYTRDGCAYAYTTPAEYRDLTFYRVTAAAFAAWLSAHGMEPSPHIAAWFKTQGVGAASATAAPGVALAAEDAGKTIEDVVKRRRRPKSDAKSTPGLPWLEWEVEACAEWLRQGNGGLTHLAGMLGISHQALGPKLKGGGFDSKGQKLPAPPQRADAFGGMASSLKTGTTGR